MGTTRTQLGASTWGEGAALSAAGPHLGNFQNEPPYPHSQSHQCWGGISQGVLMGWGQEFCSWAWGPSDAVCFPKQEPGCSHPFMGWETICSQCSKGGGAGALGLGLPTGSQAAQGYVEGGYRLHLDGAGLWKSGMVSAWLPKSCSVPQYPHMPEDSMDPQPLSLWREESEWANQKQLSHPCLGLGGHCPPLGQLRPVGRLSLGFRVRRGQGRH